MIHWSCRASCRPDMIGLHPATRRSVLLLDLVYPTGVIAPAASRSCRWVRCVAMLWTYWPKSMMTRSEWWKAAVLNSPGCGQGAHDFMQNLTPAACIAMQNKRHSVLRCLRSCSDASPKFMVLFHARDLIESWKALFKRFHEAE